MDNEWITINKDVFDIGRYESYNVFKLFLYFLTNATTQSKTVKGQRLERGQLLVTRKAVCEATKMTERNYRTAMSILGGDQQPTNNRPTTDQRMTNNLSPRQIHQKIRHLSKKKKKTKKKTFPPHPL